MTRAIEAVAIMARGGFALPRVLGDATLLLSGGVAGLVTR